MSTLHTYTHVMNTPRPLAIKHYGSEHTGDTINVVWESDHNVHQVKETGQFYTATVKQTVQSVSVDVLGSTTLVGQDVYAKPSLCQNPHSATDDSLCRDCCPDIYHSFGNFRCWDIFVHLEMYEN